ncbi:ERG2/sigma1 receptor-like protein [Artemisia annua]|uniref:ERG2/sigma1 receptor-like protein n=1 Tax=Artemisia annua TaxID=35608 RepID=A0A2U1PDG0_ARTAN|nr:ERG2/sigma1 receptor-like protein [Artemisia annua]
MTNTTIQTPKSTRCRRDANCTCETCLASINATLDLMPSSSKAAKPSPPVTPLFFNPSTVSTPRSEAGSCLVADLTKRSDFEVKIEKKKTGFRYGLMMMKCVVVLCLVFVGNIGVKFVGERILKTKLSGEIVRDLSERAVGFDDVKEKLRFLYSEIRNLVQEGGFRNPKWEIVQDGLILRSHCRLYKSGIEEVSIWGWPLQTAGLLTTEFDSRSFTILSGRVTEWMNGESSCLIRNANTSWEQGQWNSSVWRLDENTWILEYKRSFVFENTRPFWSAFWSATEFVKFKMMKAFQWVKDLQKSIDGNYIAPT